MKNKKQKKPKYVVYIYEYMCGVYMCVLYTPCALHVVNPHPHSWRLTSAGRDRTMVSVRPPRTVQRGARQTDTRGPGSHAALRCPARVLDVSARRSRACRERARARLPPVDPSRAVSGPSPDGRAQPGSVCGQTQSAIPGGGQAAPEMYKRTNNSRQARYPW
jgi:hypothetical protein